jgi:hypothetical protein
MQAIPFINDAALVFDEATFAIAAVTASSWSAKNP